MTIEQEYKLFRALRVFAHALEVLLYNQLHQEIDISEETREKQRDTLDNLYRLRDL